MGSLFGGGKTSSSSTTDSAPWAPQQPYILQSMQDAQNLYNTQKGTQYPGAGALYAGINSTQQSGVGALTGNGNNFLQQGGNLQTTGGYATGWLPTATNNAGALASGNFNQGNTAAGAAASGLAPITTGATAAGLTGVLSSANGDATGANIASANQYANNPAVTDAINASLLDANRNLNENTLPSLNAQAISSGNLNSSRAGAAEAIAQRSATEQAAQTAAQIRSSAYNTGLQLAESGRVADMSANLGAAGAGNVGTNVAVTGQQANNTNRLANLGVQSGANGQLLSAVGAGSGLLSQGAGLQQTGATNLLTGGGVLQQDQQAQDNANLQSWNGQLQTPWSLLNNEANLVANRNWGGTSTTNSTTTQSGNPLGTILGAGSLLAAPFTGGASLMGAGADGILSGGVGGIGGILGGLTGANGLSGIFGTGSGLLSAANQYLNPYGASGSGLSLLGSNGMLGGGI